MGDIWNIFVAEIWTVVKNKQEVYNLLQKHTLKTCSKVYIAAGVIPLGV